MEKQKKKSKYDKRKFIAAFCVAMALFAAIRHGFSINIPLRSEAVALTAQAADMPEEVMVDYEPEIEETPPLDTVTPPENFDPDATIIPSSIPDSLHADSSEDTTFDSSTMPSSQHGHNGHRIIGVHSWFEAFPDSQAVQLAAAQRNGIRPCASREEALQFVRKHKLVDITNSPFYTVDDLTHSMPFLVPKAQQLLNTICLNFIDSLIVKGMQPHLPMVTSVLRTTDDVSKLQRGNKNATTNSCHCYGTTVDITYNRFVPLTGHYNPRAELTRWSLPIKQVLAEVLRDLREQGFCYVKYERKQACFHLTVR